MRLQSNGGIRFLLKHLAAWGMPLGLLATFATPVSANVITSATASSDCSSMTIQFTTAQLVPGHRYEIDWSISASSCVGSGYFTDIPNLNSNVTPIAPLSDFTFTAPASGNFDTGPQSFSFGSVPCPLTLCNDITNKKPPFDTFNNGQGGAILIDLTNNTVQDQVFITFGGQDCVTVTCPPPTSTPCPSCAAVSCIQSNFNGTAIPAGDSIWFNVHIKASGVPPTGATITFCGSTVTSSAFSATVPNGVIVFSPSVTCATTSFNSSTNTWTTTVPVSGSDEIFLTGLALPVTSGLPGGGISPHLCGNFSASVSGISVQWQWGAAVYTRFTQVYNLLNVKPTHQNACNVNNGDHAGTPENPSFQAYVTGGATGGGGSNFTGSWSGTGNTGPLCVP